jgi:putative lipoic acid-binding regulatory protein
MNKENPEEFYKRLKVQLAESTKWPSLYLYKFIVLTDDQKIRQVHEVFDNTGAVIDSKKSKKGKYTSLSITVNLKNPDEVIAKYKEVGEIEGVISL